MKKVLTLIVLVLLTSCGSYNSIDSFYNAHKNDDDVLAIRVPQVMFTLLGSISPEMEALVGTTKDLRYMQLPSATPSQTQYLNRQMNNLTGNSFIEVFRKNDKTKRNVVSIRERRNVVKEILVYNNDNLNGSILYFSGNFDPVMVRELAEKNKFDAISDGVIGKFSPQTPGITNE